MARWVRAEVAAVEGQGEGAGEGEGEEGERECEEEDAFGSWWPGAGLSATAREATPPGETSPAVEWEAEERREEGNGGIRRRRCLWMLDEIYFSWEVMTL